MVRKINKKGGSWHEPPYSPEEEESSTGARGMALLPLPTPLLVSSHDPSGNRQKSRRQSHAAVESLNGPSARISPFGEMVIFALKVLHGLQLTDVRPCLAITRCGQKAGSDEEPRWRGYGRLWSDL
jgi:hypothetical protein